MSCILKIAYQHKHKKYRFHHDKLINFNQIRQQLAIHLPSSMICYHIEGSSNGSPFARTKEQLKEMIFDQEQLTNYLKIQLPEEQKTVKIKVMNKQPNEIRQDRSEDLADMEEGCIPMQLEKIRSRSEEIQLKTLFMGQISDSMEITQEFLCNSQIEFFKIEKSKQMEEIEQELLKNSRKIKLANEKRHYTDLAKLCNYWDELKKSQI